MPQVLLLEIQMRQGDRRAFALSPGTEAIVGRSEFGSQIRLNDFSISRRHFAIRYDGRESRVVDMASRHGIVVNGYHVSDALLFPGDLIRVGMTLIRVRFADAAPPEAIPVPSAPNEEHLDRFFDGGTTGRVFGSRADRLSMTISVSGTFRFAVLDAARGPEVYRRVLECRDRTRCLFDEPRASELAVVAPYLVELPGGSATFKDLAENGWGRSWGIFLCASRGFHELRDDLAQLAKATAASGRDAVFRFYDPRVLRTHLPVGEPRGVAYFREVETYLCEREDGWLNRYTLGPNGIEVSSMPLDG